MSDLSLWDILLLKDEIDVWQWMLYSVIIPIGIVLCIIAVIFLWEPVSNMIWRLKNRRRSRR